MNTDRYQFQGRDMEGDALSAPNILLPNSMNSGTLSLTHAPVVAGGVKFGIFRELH